MFGIFAWWLKALSAKNNRCHQLIMVFLTASKRVMADRGRIKYDVWLVADTGPSGKSAPQLEDPPRRIFTDCVTPPPPTVLLPSLLSTHSWGWWWWCRTSSVWSAPLACCTPRCTGTQSPCRPWWAACTGCSWWWRVPRPPSPPRESCRSLAKGGGGENKVNSSAQQAHKTMFLFITYSLSCPWPQVGADRLWTR